MTTDNFSLTVLAKKQQKLMITNTLKAAEPTIALRAVSSSDKNVPKSEVRI